MGSIWKKFVSDAGRLLSKDLFAHVEMDRVKSEEVKELLIKVGRREAIPELINPLRTWEETFCGNVPYTVDGWEIVIFNDCNSWDYIDSVVAPDGRIGDYLDWFEDKDFTQSNQPDDCLYFENSNLYDEMVDCFINAK